jgi:hypothetical protein
VRAEQRDIYVVKLVLESFYGIGGSLKVSKEQAGAWHLRVICPIAMSELVPDSQANPNHSLGNFVFSAETCFSKFAPRKRIGGVNAARRCSQSIQRLANWLGHSGCMSRVSADCKFYLSKAGKKLADKQRLLWKAIEGGVDTVRSISITVAHDYA